MNCGGSYLTVGLLGRFEPDAVLLGFLDALVDHYRNSGRRLCILLPFLINKHNKIALRLLELKKSCPDLKVELVIDQKQKWAFLKGTKSIVGLERNRIIDSADKVHIVDEHGPEVVFVRMQRFFAEHADVILFASHAEMEYCWEKIKSLPIHPRALMWEPKRMFRLQSTPVSKIYCDTQPCSQK